MVFQTFYIGNGLSLWERCCLRSFVDHGHEIIVFTYDEILLPEGVRRVPAREIVSESDRDAFFAQAPRQFSRFANFFRYVLLNRRGGWWVDTDVLCQSRRMPQDEIVLGWESDVLICSAIMRLPSGHGILEDAIRFAWEQRAVDRWAYTGPMLLTRLVRDHGLTHLIRRPRDLYPLPYESALDLIDPAKGDAVAEIVGHAPLLHFWHAIFRLGGFQTNFRPPEASYLGRAFARHGAAEAPTLEADAIARQIKLIADSRAAMTLTELLRGELERLRGLVP